MTRTQWRRERQRQQRESEAWNQAHMSIVGELKDCRQLSDDHWQGIDVDGVILDVKGGPMPKYLFAPLPGYVPYRDAWGWTCWGIIRLTRA